MAQRLRTGVSVRVRVPASSANLGPGFDSVGLALGLWDSCVATVTAEPGLQVEVHGEGEGEVPLDATHLVHRTMVGAWRELGVPPPQGLHLVCDNAVPHGRGLGSSATAIVTGIVAAQGLYDASRGSVESPDLRWVNDLAARLEGHPDNSSASVHGGLTLSWPAADGATSTLRLQLHPEVAVRVLLPTTQLSTARARSVLPSHVRHAEAAANSARAALLLQALTARPDLLLDGTREWLHQEARRESFTASMALVDDLRGQGHAAVISGAGPSVLVLSTRDRVRSVAVERAGWQVLDLEVPDHGATVDVLAD
jgi:homoserine kinase